MEDKMPTTTRPISHGRLKSMRPKRQESQVMILLVPLVPKMPARLDNCAKACLRQTVAK
jgi:hypothetical protein